MEGITSHSFIQTGICDEFDRICKNCFCLLPHCGCATPFNINFESYHFTSTSGNFQQSQHLQMHVDIHESLYDEVFYSSTSESGGFQQKCEPLINNEIWLERE